MSPTVGSESAVKNRETSWQVRILAGAASSAAIATLVQPLEVMKTLVQARLPVANTPTQAMKHVIQAQGVRALWRGLPPSLIRTVPGVTLYFFLLSEVNRMEYFREYQKTNPSACDFVTAGTARAFCTVVLLPLTVVKTRFEAMAATKATYNGTFHAISTIIKKERFRSLYSGLTASLIRDIPSAGVFFVIYEFGRSYTYSMLQTSSSSSSPSTLSSSQKFLVPLFVGGCAGCVSTLLTQPPDVIRVRQQIEGGRAVDIMKEVIQKNGFRGLFAGATPRIIRRSFSTAFTWATFEGIIHVFEGLVGDRR